MSLARRNVKRRVAPVAARINIDPAIQKKLNGANVAVSAATTSADFTLGSSGNTRTLTCASKTATASGSGDPTHIVFVNTATSKILGVTQESSGVTVSTGTSYTLPSIVLEMRQPVAV